MLSTAITADLVKKLNDQTDIPFINEAQEGAAIQWLVDRVTPVIPNWVVAFMASAVDGLTVDELKVHKGIAVAQVNKLVDLPGTPEFIEEKLIRFVIDGVFDWALKGNVAPKGALYHE
jgi:hypothetical protein